jgi:hypothetical protein
MHDFRTVVITGISAPVLMSWTDCLTIVSEKLPTRYGCVTCVHSDFIGYCSQDNAAWYNVHTIGSFFTWWPVSFIPEIALLSIVSWEAGVQLSSGSVFWPLMFRGSCWISPPPRFDTRTVQPVASHYIDWAITAHTNRTLNTLCSEDM